MTDYDAIEREYGEEDGGKRRSPPPALATLLPGVVDVALHNEETAFLVHENGQLVPTDTRSADGQSYRPFPARALPWAVPTFAEVECAWRDDTPTDLFEDVRLFLGAAAVLPDARWADLLAGWALLTYRAEDVHHIPIPLVHGVPERGKSRLGKAVVYASWRGFVSPGIREAVLIRWRDYHRATICLDLEDVSKQAARAGVEDLLLASFERGGTVARVLWPERGPGRDMRHFRAYGPTVITTNRAPRQDSALAKRGFESPPDGAESKPRRRRPHRATGKPRGGKGQGKMIRTIAARLAGTSLRSVERIERVERYSPTLYGEIKRGAVEAAVAERVVDNILWTIRLREPTPTHWPQDRMTRRVIREVRVAYKREQEAQA